jgi:hypothetical protein
MFKVCCPGAPALDMAEAASEPMVLLAALFKTEVVVEWWFFEDVLTDSHLVVFWRPLIIAGLPIWNWSLLLDFFLDCWSYRESTGLIWN